MADTTTTIDLKSHQERHDDGGVSGKDPRTLSPADLEAMGIKHLTPIEAIRAKCLDCMVGSVIEVRRCAMKDCPNWSYRLGTNPWIAKRELSDEQRAAAAERFKQVRARAAV